MEGHDAENCHVPEKLAIVSIYLGSVYSAVSFLRFDQPGQVQLSSCHESVAANLPDGSWLFGPDAITSLSKGVGHRFSSPKESLLKLRGDCGYDAVFISSDNNPTIRLPFIEVYRLFLIWLKKCGLRSLRRDYDQHIEDANICWVITLPVTLFNNDYAKGFLREAAVRAKLINQKDMDNDRHLLFVIEPDATCIALAPNHDVVVRGQLLPPRQEPRQSVFQPEQKFCLLDCGGGFTHISRHEITKLEQMRLIGTPCVEAGCFGSEKVSDSIRAFVNYLFGQVVKDPREFREHDGLQDLVRQLRNNAPLVRSPFSVANRNLTPIDPLTSSDRAPNLIDTLQIPMRNLLSEEQIGILKTVVQQYNRHFNQYMLSFDSSQCVLSLNHAQLLYFFDDCIRDIVDLVKRFTNNLDNVLVVVGGFSDSDVLRGVLQNMFGTQMSLVYSSPHLVSRTVLMKGATLLAWKTLRSTVCTHTSVSCIAFKIAWNA